MSDDVELEHLDLIELELSEDVSLSIDVKEQEIIVERSQDDDQLPEFLYTVEDGWQKEVWDRWELGKLASVEEVVKFCETVGLSIKAPDGV